MKMGDTAFTAKKDKGSDQSKNMKNCCLTKLPTQLAGSCPWVPQGSFAQGLLWVGRSQASQPQKWQECPSSALPQLKHPAEKQKIFAQAQHGAKAATLLLEHGQLTQDRLRG